MLTDEQVVTLKDDMITHEDDPVAIWLAQGRLNRIVAYYNELADPDVWVFRESVSVESVITSMDWGEDYAAFKDDIPGIELLLRNGVYYPESENARDALNTVFSSAANTKQAILTVCTRQATKGEALFIETATGPGGGDGSSKPNSAIANFKGDITLDDVRAAVALI